MRISISGNEDMARSYLPIVKSRANNLKELSEKRGLSQNVDSFIFKETNTRVFIRYSFGELQLSISSPIKKYDGSVSIEERTKEPIIWIKKFDNLIFGSYNGMFFDLTSFIYPRYEEIDLIIRIVEKKLPHPDASVSIPVSKFDSWNISSIDSGLSSSLYIGSITYSEDGAYINRNVNIVDGDTFGYYPSCFYSESADLLKWKYGGDIEYPELDEEIFGSSPFSYSTADYAICAYHFKDPNITFGIGFLRDEFRTRIEAAIATISPSPPSDLVNSGIDGFFYKAFDVAPAIVAGAPNVYPNGWVPNWNSGQISTASDFIYARLDAKNVTVSANLLHYQPELTYPEYPQAQDEKWDFDIIIAADVSIKISMVREDGVVVHDSIPLYNESGYTIYGQNALTVRPGFPNTWTYPDPFYSGLGTRVQFAFKSFYVPSSVWTAKRNFIQLSTTLTWVFDLNSPMWFVGMAQQAFAYRAETGWLPCSALSGIVICDDEAEIFLCARWTFYDGYYPDFSLVGRNLDGDHYIFNAIFNFRGDWAKSLPGYYGFPDVRFILNKNGSLFSLHGAYGSTSGVYRITKSSATLIHPYAPSEIEPVFMSDDGNVLVTKSKIYINNIMIADPEDPDNEIQINNRVIDCTECCGIYLDYTHFADKVGPDAFVIKRILADTEIVVDTLAGRGHNFYELSEDSSVCIISAYYTDPLSTTSPSYAVVLDFADPVYRFEASDQIINQFMDSSIFYGENADKLGYPTAIPFGARYVTSCSCFRQYNDGRESQVVNHYVYNPMPGGTTLLKKIGEKCPMSNRFVPGVLLDRLPIFPSSKAIVPQYHRATVQRGNPDYDDKRLNKFIYHHTGRILRRISDGLFPFNKSTSTEVVENAD